MNKNSFHGRSGFTIVELLIVIAVIAVLAIVTIFIINPSQFEAQGRDSNRLSDVTTLNQEVALYHQTTPMGSLGTSTVIYISVPDPSATSTAGDQCQGLGLTAPSGYTYHCAASSSYRNIDGTGWIPVNFSNLPGHSLATLPVDPVNTTSSGEYYTYTASGSQYAVMANPESTKTSSSSLAEGNDVALLSSSGGTSGPITYTSKTYTVDSDPSSIAFDSNTNTIWVTNENSNSVTVFNSAFATSTYTVGNSPEYITFDSHSIDSHSNTLWISNWANNSLTEINDTTFVTSTYSLGAGGRAAGGISFDPNTNTLWAGSAGNGNIVLINDTTLASSSLNININSYHAPTFNSSTNTMYESDMQDGQIYVINANAPTSTYQTITAGSPYNGVYDSHNNTMWVPNQSDVLIYSGTSLIATSTMGINWTFAAGMTFDPHTNSMWVVNNVHSGTVTAINDTTFATSTYAVGENPTSVAFDTNANSIWVTNSGDNTVTVLTPSR